LGLPLVLVGGEAELDVDEVYSDMSKVDGGMDDMDDVVLLPTLDVLPAGLPVPEPINTNCLKCVKRGGTCQVA